MTRGKKNQQKKQNWKKDSEKSLSFNLQFENAKQSWTEFVLFSSHSAILAYIKSGLKCIHVTVYSGIINHLNENMCS